MPPGAVSSPGGPECRLQCRPHEHTWESPLAALSRHQGLEPLGAMRWAWAAAMALWLQVTLLGGVGAQREPKRPRQPSQRTEPPTATASNSEGLLRSPKVRTGWLLAGVGVRALPGFRRPPGSGLSSHSQALPCPALQASPSCLGAVGLWAGLAAAALGAATGSPGPRGRVGGGEGLPRGAAAKPLKPQVPRASSSLLPLGVVANSGVGRGGGGSSRPLVGNPGIPQLERLERLRLAWALCLPEVLALTPTV